jgi:hypothetical protein
MLEALRAIGVQDAEQQHVVRTEGARRYGAEEPEFFVGAIDPSHE